MSVAILADSSAWGRRMAQLKEISWSNLVAAICSVATLGVLGGTLLFGVGSWHEGDSAAISEVKGQLGILSSQVSRLGEKIDAGPRADQVQDITRHEAAADGRMDSLDARMRAIEAAQAGLTARIEGIAAQGHR